MKSTNPITIRRLALVLILAITAVSLAACGGRENIRDNGNGQGAGAEMQGAQGANGQGNGIESRRDIDVRGLEGIPESERAQFLDPSNPLSTRTIYFPFDSNVIASKYQAAIQAHAHFLSEHPGITLRLEGNTDERGTRDYNVALGERRADAVKQALVLSGANAGQIKTISYGEERPAVLGHTEAAYAKNRRVDFIYPKN